MEVAALRWISSAAAFNSATAAAANGSWRTRWRPAMARRGARLTVVSAGCKTCKGKGAVECPGCKERSMTVRPRIRRLSFVRRLCSSGVRPLFSCAMSRRRMTSSANCSCSLTSEGTGKNKKNGNIFERWKCFDCQGFGLKSCPSCGKGGLTPEQRGER